MRRYSGQSSLCLFVDKHVISQESAKRALSVAVCDHYNFVRRCLATPSVAEQHHLKPNVLLMGPSGSGKTHLLRALTKLLRVPFVKADATKFSATGYARNRRIVVYI